jgi:transcriptional regulator with XRE-family HTH domain
MSRKSLTDEQNERLREHVRGLLKRYNGNQSELAPRLGMSQPAISAFLARRQGTSYRLVERLAVLLKMDERDVLHGPSDVPNLKVVETDPRRLAARLADEDGVYPTAIQSVLDEAESPENEGRSTLWWAMRMKLREHEMLAHSATLPSTRGIKRKRSG